jgi:hypothetical protein
MGPEIAFFVTFMVVINLALSVEERIKKKRQRALTIPRNHVRIKP